MRRSRLSSKRNCLHLRTIVKQLQKENDLQRRVIACSKDMVLQMSEQGLIEYVSPSYGIVLGYPDEKVMGKSVFDFVHPSDLQLTKEALARFKSTGISKGVEYRVRDADGRVVWVSTHAQKIFDQSGRITGYMLCGRDITDRKMAEEKSLLSQQKLASAFRYTADMIAISRLSDGTLLDVNDAFIKFTGYTRDEVIGNSILELGLWGDASKRVEFVNQLLADGSVYCYEALFRMKSGEFRIESLSAEIINIDNEECIVTVWRDVTDTRKAEENLKLQNAYFQSLHETSLALINRLDINELLEIIVQKTCSLTNVSNAYISLINPDTGLPEIKVGTGIYQKQVGRVFRANEGISGTVWQTGKPVLVNDYSTWPNRAITSYYMEIKSALGIPLMSASGVVGVIGLTTKNHEKILGSNDEKLLSRFAELASIALDNAKLYTASQKEIAERVRIENELRHISTHDYVTGLFNRAKFDQELKLWDEAGLKYCLFACDVDGLKLINDSMGHHAGDKVLLAAANVLKSAVTEESIVARTGGDEFVIACLCADNNEPETICANIKAAVGKYNESNNQHPLSISTGYAIRETTVDNMAAVLKRADDAMYREKLHHGRSVRSSIVQGLLTALEARDYITEGHADRMQDIASDLGAAMGLTDRELAQLRLIAQFHDIGKVGIPDNILFKPGPLNPEEFADMKRHCEIGHRIALSIPELAHIAQYILSHHEWWNGNGYPQGLKSEDIPLECRIIAVADAYDAMTNDRPYRNALSHDEAVAEIVRNKGRQFDPQIVEVFVNKYK